MARTQRRSTEKERFWRDVFRHQPRSGLSIRGFCRREGLSEPSYHAWKRTLAERAASARQRSGGSIQRVRVRRAAGHGKPTTTFVPLSIGPASGPSAMPVEIFLPSGVRIGVSPAADARLLGDVLRALDNRTRPV
jgi:hypothetical protein